MTTPIFTNNASAVLAAGITNVATTLVVSGGQGAAFPAPSGGRFALLTIEDSDGFIEIVRLITRVGDTFTIARAQEGTVARAFAATSRVENRVTAGVLNAYLLGSGSDITGTLAMTGAGRIVNGELRNVVIRGADGGTTNQLTVPTGGGAPTIGTDAIMTTATHPDPHRLATGSAAAPAYSFSVDPDTGVFRVGPDVVGVATAGVERWRAATDSVVAAVPSRGPGGAAAAPTFSFSGDPDTGVYQMAPDTLGFAEAGVGFRIGFRDIPRRTAGFAIGQCLATAVNVTLNTSDMAAGAAFNVYNDSAAAITITQGAGVTLRLNGTATTGNRTVQARGMAFIWCNSASEAIISGAVT